MKISVVVTHFYRERLPNVPSLVAALAAGTLAPHEIIVWNNDQPVTWPIGMKASVIQSHRNVGCRARFIAALTTVGDHVLFQDNDLMVLPRTLEDMARWSRELPDSIVSLDGYVIAPDGSYSSRRSIRATHQPTEMTVTLGRLEIVSRRILLRLLTEFPLVSDGDSMMDDLWFSACARRNGVKIWAVPTVGFLNLPTYGVGLSLTNKSAYYEERDRTFRSMFGSRS